MPELNPEASFGYLVRRCHRRFDRLLSARLAPHDLQTGFWYYLRALWTQDDVTQKQLSDVTNVAENTTVSLINRMAEEGLVARTRSTVDRRKMRVQLTDKGRKLEDELMPYAIEINLIAKEGIDPEHLAICADVLRRMSANLKAAFDAAANNDQGRGHADRSPDRAPGRQARAQKA